MDRSAYPQQGMTVGGELLDRQFGMTLREHFVESALRGLLANPALVPDATAAQEMPALAALIADAALALLDEDPLAVKRKEELARLEEAGVSAPQIKGRT